MSDNLNGLRRYLEKYATLAENRKHNIDIAANEFLEIRNISADLKKELTSLEGAKESNRKKNRYKDILPYDGTRVKLEVSSFNEGTDYINANIIKDHKNKVTYIASQGPMPHTVNDFWKMTWSYQVQLIVMACKEIELGKARCERYWPLNKDSEENYDGISVKLFNETNVAKNLVLRELHCVKKNNKKKIFQLHYMDWPDHGAPETFDIILNLLKLARKIQPSDQTPLLIHCSAGCGRTGAIIAIDLARKMIEEKVKELSVFSIVKHLREQRPAMVQTKEQYEFVYEVIRELVLKELRKCDENFDNCSPEATYENIQFVLKDKDYIRSKSSEDTLGSLRDMPRSKSAENLCKAAPLNREPAPPAGGMSTPTQRKQIVLPTEHAINTTGNFRRSRSQNRRAPFTATSTSNNSRPPLPRKGSESVFTAEESNQNKKTAAATKQFPTKISSSPSSGQLQQQLRPQFEYENISGSQLSKSQPAPTRPTAFSLESNSNTNTNTNTNRSNKDPLSPFADEEFIPVAKPVGLASYPMKTALLQVSSIEHQHRPIKQTRSHEHLPQNPTDIPPNIWLSPANEKPMRKSSSTNDILDDLERSKRAADNPNVARDQHQQQQLQKASNIKANVNHQQQQLNAVKTPSSSNNIKAGKTHHQNPTKIDPISNATTSGGDSNNSFVKNKTVNAAGPTTSNKNSGSCFNANPTSKIEGAGASTTSAAVNLDANQYAVVNKSTAFNADDLYSVVNKSTTATSTTTTASKTAVGSATYKDTPKQQQQQGTKPIRDDGLVESFYTNVDTKHPPAKNSIVNNGVCSVNATNRVVQKPPAPTFGGMGVERNRSSVKKGIMEDKKKASLKKKNSPDQWTLSVATSNCDAPPLPERTPESYIILDSDDDQTIRSSSASTSPSTSDTKPKDVVSEPAPYTLISSLTNTQQQHQLNKSSALVHPHYTPLTPTPPQPPTVSSEKSSASSSNWNPITKIFNKNKSNEDSINNSVPDSKMSNSLPISFSHLGFGKRLKKKPVGPREMPVKFRYL